MTIPFEELAGYPKMSGGRGQGNAATRMFLVPWTQALDFVALVAGGAQPAKWPDERLKHCRLQTWSIDPHDSIVPSGTVTDPTTQIHTYVQANGNAAIVTLQYGIDFLEKEWPSDVPMPDHRADTSLRLRIRGNGQYLSIPGRMTEWESLTGEAGPFEDQPLFTLIALADFQISWENVVDPPLARLQGLIGKTNSDDVLGCPPGTLLFENYEEDDAFHPNPLAPHTNRIGVSLKYRNAGSEDVIDDGGTPEDPFDDVVAGKIHYGWNYEYRDTQAEDDEPGWHKVVMSDGEPRYAETPFADIFT